MIRSVRISAISVPFLALLLSWPGAAYPCDVDNGGDSGSSDSGSSDTYDDSEPSCVDVTDIVGRAQCRSFGDWDITRMPRLRIGLGTSISVFPFADLSFHGHAEHDGPIPYSLINNGIASTDAVAATIDGRITRLVGRHGYVGSVFSMGAVTLPGLRAKSIQGMSVDTQAGMYMSLGFLTGASLELGNWVVRGEAQVGRRFIFVTVETRQEDCIDHSTVQAGQWMVRPQLAIETWLSPRLSAGIKASTDALRDRDLAGGLYLQLHTRTFDGLRSRR